MTNNEKNFIQGLKHIRLDSEAKLRIREQLVAYSELHSMPAIEKVPFNGLSFMVSIYGRSRRLLATTLVLALLLVGGGASAFAAEKTVPGDVLYPVKIRITEPVAAVFAGSGDARARHHARLVVRRIQEAEILRSRGALTQETEELLSAKIDTETNKVLEEAGSLARAGDISASVAVRADLANLLVQYVDENSIEDTGTETAVMSAGGTELTTSADTARAPVNKESRTVRNILGKKIILLRVPEDTGTRASTHTSEDTETESTAVKQKPDVRGVRGLLSGSSVVEDARRASTTATSTPAFGKKFIEQIIKRKDSRNTDQSRNAAEERVSDTNTHVPTPTTVFPENILPIRTNIGL